MYKNCYFVGNTMYFDRSRARAAAVARNVRYYDQVPVINAEGYMEGHNVFDELKVYFDKYANPFEAMLYCQEFSGYFPQFGGYGVSAINATFDGGILVVMKRNGGREIVFEEFMKAFVEASDDAFMVERYIYK